MRGAERFLAQGKLRAAIGEYEQVIKNDPKDFGTFNILGDLYIKTSAKTQAIACYTLVAEHYGSLGFTKKAIAVYNKIAKLEPNSLDVSARLAELYKQKGSIREARSHYVTLAEHYEKTGKKVEALAIWKQIALLDQNNTDVFLHIAEAYIAEGQPDEALDAYCQCGLRLAKQNHHDEALDCFNKALEIRADDPNALAGFVASKFAQNAPGEAAETLELLLDGRPFNLEITHQLIDCYLAADDTASAEKTIIRLVEREPANYPKFLQLASIYLDKNELESTIRILSMSTEQMLVGGQAAEFNTLVREVLVRDPEHLEALRLLVRYCAWQRDEQGFRNALISLAEIAQRSGCVEDERYALSQLMMIAPHELEYAARLKQINEVHGFEDEALAESLFDKQFFKERSADEVSTNVRDELANVDELADDEKAWAGDFPPVDEELQIHVSELPNEDPAIEDDPETRLAKEIESIRFYVDSGYFELAEKAVHELRGEFDERPEIAELDDYLRKVMLPPAGDVESAGTAIDANRNGFDFGDLSSELGFEDTATTDHSDYETHYQTAVAYKEMGLIEQAIAEFQEAINGTSPNDGTRRFFQCANLLGHCFMEQGMPKLALKWFNRTLETPGVDEEEKQALWYEVAAAYELDGDQENAARYFEYVYAENVDFRDVSQRMKAYTVSR